MEIGQEINNYYETFQIVLIIDKESREITSMDHQFFVQSVEIFLLNHNRSKINYMGCYSIVTIRIVNIPLDTNICWKSFIKIVY